MRVRAVAKSDCVNESIQLGVSHAHPHTRDQATLRTPGFCGIVFGIQFDILIGICAATSRC